MSEENNQPKQPTEEELQKAKEEFEKEVTKRTIDMMKKLNPLELYKAIHEEGWKSGFDAGIEAEVDELHEAAENLSELHVHALHDMMDGVEEKYTDPEEEKDEGN